MSTPLQKAAAWSVHAYTALGVVCGFAALLATVRADYRQAFLWLVAATAIDASDGVLARAARVKEHLPAFDGARLDDIVDYLTYVIAPVFLLYSAGSLPEGWGAGVAAVVLLSSAYGFAAADAKSDDYFFTGFPSYWNIVAVYLFAAGLPQPVNAAILLALSVLVFVRIGYIYPFTHAGAARADDRLRPRMGGDGRRHHLDDARGAAAPPDRVALLPGLLHGVVARSPPAAEDLSEWP